MQELARLEDLPLDYRDALTAQNLVPRRLGHSGTRFCARSAAT